MKCPTIKKRVMKTYYPINLKNCGFFLTGIVAIITTSCGSYQNASYYDNDGVYGSSERSNQQVVNRSSEENVEQSNEYAQKFRAMQDDYTYFTDVDSYQSQVQDTVVTVYNNQYSDQNYAGWGNNGASVTVNYYDNGMGWNNWYSPYWGYSNVGWGAGWGWNNWGMGWNAGWGWNSWYGPNWGMGWNNWYGNGYYGPGWGGYYNNGWGWNGYGGRNVAYNGGPRGGNGYYNNGSGRTGSNYSTGRRASSTEFNGTPRTSNTRGSFQNPRSAQQNNSPRTTTVPRTYSPRQNNAVTPRNTTSEPRNNQSTPRNNTSEPRNNNYSSPRSSSSGGSFGGSSGGGGGRSSGGGGGRGGRG